MNIHFEIITLGIILISIINHGDTTKLLNRRHSFTVNITMTNFNTTQEDQYTSVSYKLPDEELMIIGYTPLVETNATHHLITYACTQPIPDKSFWINGSSCAGEQMFIHGWVWNTPPLILPRDVGFAVGRNTPYKYIVVNIQYLSTVRSDNSGVQLEMTRSRLKYHAGVIIGGTGQINLKPNTQNIRTSFSCRYKGPRISIFAAAAHTHQRGRANSLNRIRNGHLLPIIKDTAIKQPGPFAFKPYVRIHKGDYLMGNCIYDNNDDRVILHGPTRNEEMCIVYVYYSYQSRRKTNGTAAFTQPPIGLCWDDQNNTMTNLVSPDPVVVLLKPIDNKISISESTSTSSSANISYKLESTTSKGLPKRPFDRQIFFNNKRIRVFLLILAIACVLMLIIVIVCSIIRIRNKDRRDHLNIIKIDEKNDRNNGGSVFNNWFNRPKHVERLEQVTDEENQLLESDEDNQASDPFVGNDIIAIKSKQKTTTSDNKNSTVKFKIGDNL